MHCHGTTSPIPYFGQFPISDTLAYRHDSTSRSNAKPGALLLPPPSLQSSHRDADRHRNSASKGPVSSPAPRDLHSLSKTSRRLWTPPPVRTSLRGTREGGDVVAATAATAAAVALVLKKDILFQILIQTLCLQLRESCQCFQLRSLDSLHCLRDRIFRHRPSQDSLRSGRLFRWHLLRAQLVADFDTSPPTGRVLEQNHG